MSESKREAFDRIVRDQMNLLPNGDNPRAWQIWQLACEWQAGSEKADALADSQYLRGLQMGYRLGLSGNETEYQKAVGSRAGAVKVIKAC